MRGFRIPGLILFGLCMSGCISSQPLVSHAHIGHALTTWHDTPGQEGLLDVAESHVGRALDAATQGCTSTDPDAAGRALNRTLVALAPEFGRRRKPGYGAIRALSGTLEHLEFAAGTEDASLNLVTSVAEITPQGAELSDRLVALAIDLKRQLAAGQVRCRSLVAALEAAVDGTLTDPPTIGLTQFRAQVQAMLARETDPPYEPLARRYVLGLVRLPNGSWDFRLGRPPQRSAIGYGLSGGSGY